ncbi:MAG: hypothetical protein ABI361_08515 [Nitrososphaera sp.]|jgi:hypothetical protein
MPDEQELEAAINRVLASERKDINPLYSIALNRTATLFIKTIESAPRDYDRLTEMIRQKEAAIAQAEDCFDIDVLDTERDALDRLRGIVQAWQMGRNLDSIAY